MKKNFFLRVIGVIFLTISFIACNKKMTPATTTKSYCDQLWDELQKPQEINGVTFITETKAPTVYDIDTLIKYGELDATGFGLEKPISLKGFEGSENSYLKDGIRYVERDNSFQDASICPAEVAKMVHYENMGAYKALVIQWILRPSEKTIDFAIVPIEGNYYQLYGYYKGGFKKDQENDLKILESNQQIKILIFAKVGTKTQQSQENATTPAIPSKGSSKWGSTTTTTPSGGVGTQRATPRVP